MTRIEILEQINDSFRRDIKVRIWINAEDGLYYLNDTIKGLSRSEFESMKKKQIIEIVLTPEDDISDPM